MYDIRAATGASAVNIDPIKIAVASTILAPYLYDNAPPPTFELKFDFRTPSCRILKIQKDVTCNRIYP